MPFKKKTPSPIRRRRHRGRATKAPAKNTTESGLSLRLDELTERIDIVLPEVTARVAALEHLLLELNLCTHDDLRRARQFVREQEA
jgi:Holliday junction resolvasome RuvABC endonuclease subunit